MDAAPFLSRGNALNTVPARFPLQELSGKHGGQAELQAGEAGALIDDLEVKAASGMRTSGRA